MSKTFKQSKINNINARTLAAKSSMKTFDGFTNLAARTGFGAGSIQDSSFMAFNFVSRNRVQLEAAYRSNWVCGLSVDLVANDMTREGIEIKGSIEPDDIKTLDREMKKLQIMDNFCDQIKWDRLYGGAIAVMLIDGQDISTPLNIESIRKDQFKGLLVLDRWLVQPSLENLVTEYGPHLGKPKYYYVVADAQALRGMTIHHSRVVRMEGVTLPYWQRITENGWGQSVLERIWDRVVAFDSVTEGAAQLIYKAHLRVMRIKGLKEIKSFGGKAYEGFLAYYNQVRQFQTNEGLTLIDSDDEFIPHTYTFSGLAELSLMFAEQLSGGIQVPLVRLFGQSPGGLNSSGDSDIATYHDNVRSEQNRKLRYGMTVVLDVLYRSTFGKAPPIDFDHDYKSLSQMDDEQKSKIAQSYSEAVLKAEEAGVITKAVALRELKQISHIVGIFSNITDEDITDAENEPPLPDDLQSLKDQIPGLSNEKKDQSSKD